MNENVYMHGIGYSTNMDSNMDYNPKGQRLVLYSILDSGELKSRRKLGSRLAYGFNGLDYISLCDYNKREVYNETSKKNYNAFNSYIKNSVALCFDKDKVKEEIIVPTVVGVCTNNYRGFEYMRDLGLCDERYSDYPDEVQVKDSLSLDSLCAVTFPSYRFLDYYKFKNSSFKIKKLIAEIYELQSIVSYLGYDVPIYDINSGVELNGDTVKELVLNR